MKKTALFVAVAEVAAAAILLLITIRNIVALPSVVDMRSQCMFGNREDCYPLVVSWIMLLVSVIFYWIDKKWHWALTQITAIPLFVVLSFIPLYIGSSDWLRVLYFILYVAVVFLTERFLFRKKYIDQIGVTPKLMSITLFSGITFFFVSLVIWIIIYDTLIV